MATLEAVLFDKLIIVFVFQRVSKEWKVFKEQAQVV